MYNILHLSENLRYSTFTLNRNIVITIVSMVGERKNNTRRERVHDSVASIKYDVYNNILN
jgi:hypothetical protein